MSEYRCDQCGGSFLTCLGERCEVQRETVARIVAWLRREATANVDTFGRTLLNLASDRIERGDWREEGGGT